MNNVIVLKLGSHQEIANNTRIGWDFNTNGIIDGPHRGQGMGVRSDPARALHKVMGITGITSLQNQLNAPEHLA